MGQVERKETLRCAENYMERRTGKRKKRKEPGDHLSWEDRLTIERMLKKKCSKNVIADAVGCCRATVYNEIKRGQYEHLNSDLTTEMRYSPDIAEQKYCEHLAKTGPAPKLLKDTALCTYIERTILDKDYSPEAVLISSDYLQQNFAERITSVNTIYKGIDRGYFSTLTRFNLADGWHKKSLGKRKTQSVLSGKRQKKEPLTTARKKLMIGRPSDTGRVTVSWASRITINACWFS